MLFPSGSAYGAEDEREKYDDLDWLENKSFTSDTARKVKEFQKDLRTLQGSSGSGDEHVDNGSSVNTWRKQNSENPDNKTAFDCQKVSRKKTYHKSDSLSDSDELGQIKERDEHVKGVLQKTVAKKIQDDVDSVQTDKHKHRESKREHKDRDRKKGHKDRDRKRGHRDRDTERGHVSSDSSLAEDSRYRPKKRKKHKHKHKKSKTEKSSLQSELGEEPTAQHGVFTANVVFLDDLTSDISQKDAFRLDRKSDKNSLTYGSLYKQHIAQYTPFCYSCMGTSKQDKFVINEKEKKKKSKSIRYFNKENRKIIRQFPQEVVTVISNRRDFYSDSKQKLSDKILKLELLTEGSMHGTGNIRDNILDPSTALYIQGKSASHVRSDQTSDTMLKFHTPTQKKVAEFNRKLQENPENVNLWTEFVKYQDVVFSEDDQFESTSVGSEGIFTKVVTEKKIGIVEKALLANPGNIDLILLRLDLTSNLVESAKIIKEIEDLLFVHSANTRLWRYYLNFNRSKIALFTVSKMLKLYHKCFKALFAVKDGKVHTHSHSENLGQEILDILIDYCYFLKQTGHREKATGTVQALIEYNILCPSALKHVTKDIKMAAFKDFWDSECQRVGSKGAPGWNVWFSKKESGHKEDLSENLDDLEEKVIEQILSRSRTWMEIEKLRECHYMFPWLPGEGQTDEDCEDADQIVLFDDISPVLFDISSDQYLNLVVSLVGLDQDVTSFRYSGQSMTLNSELEYITQVPTLSGVHLSNLTHTQSCMYSEFLLQLIPYFTGDDKTILTLLYIDICVKKIARTCDVRELPKLEKKELRKILKTTLKQSHNRNNLFLWSAYIDIERQTGKPEEYLSIAETAVSMYSGSQVKWFVSEETLTRKKDEHVSGLINVFVEYIEILLGIDCGPPVALSSRSSGITMEMKQKVQYVISCLLENKKVDVKNSAELPGATVLRTLARFLKCINTILEHIELNPENSTLVIKEFVGVCWCYSLFSYCSYNLQSGLDVFAKVLQLIQDKHLRGKHNIEEMLLEWKFRLLLFHMKTAQSPLRVLREHLDEALIKFTCNPSFLALFINVERKARISGRMNRFFDKQSRRGKSPLPLIFAVSDLLREASDETDITSPGECYKDRTGILNRAKSWLENYLDQAGDVVCPLIWRLYLQIEADYPMESRLKGLFYRAIQQCPWNKNLYKDGISLLGEDKLQEIVDLMIEKELRVHLPVEELDILME